MNRFVPPKMRQKLHEKAPQIIAVAIAAAIIVILLLDYAEDVFIEGAPITTGPLGVIVETIVLFTKNVTGTVSSWGYWGVFGLMLLESSSLPIPSEVVLPFAGYLVSLGYLNFWLTVFVATVAAIAGSLIDYYIGLRAANALSEHRVLGKVLFSKNQLEIAIRWFDQYGPIVVLFSRLIPGFRTIVSFPAGAVGMPKAKFVSYTIAGCLAWNAVLIAIGYFLGSEWTKVAGFVHYIILVVVVVAVVGLVVYLIKRPKGKIHQSQTSSV